MNTPASLTPRPATQGRWRLLESEFDRQVQTLLDREYPKLLGVTRGRFRTHCEQLRENLARQVPRRLPDLEAGFVPFILVPRSPRLEVTRALRNVRHPGGAAIVSLVPAQASEFIPLPSLQLPDAPVYLLIDVFRGDDFRNVPPQDALRSLRQARRSPLTLEEGVALLTHYPDLLIKNHCFSLSGSRRGDQRVPALWLSARRPKLGWCWDRNPHSWLGSASCRRRCGLLAKR